MKFKACWKQEFKKHVFLCNYFSGLGVVGMFPAVQHVVLSIPLFLLCWWFHGFGHLRIDQRVASTSIFSMTVPQSQTNDKAVYSWKPSINHDGSFFLKSCFFSSFSGDSNISFSDVLPKFFCQFLAPPGRSAEAAPGTAEGAPGGAMCGAAGCAEGAAGGGPKTALRPTHFLLELVGSNNLELVHFNIKVEENLDEPPLVC